MAKKIKHTKMIFGGILGALLVMMMAALMTMGGAVEKIGEEKTAEKTGESEIKLVEAKMNDGSVAMSAEFFDQKQDPCVNIYDVKKQKKLKTRQFEWTSCGYRDTAMEQGMVEQRLGDGHLLVAKDGTLLPNRGLNNMKRWFSEVEGKSKRYEKTLYLDYKNEEGVEFSYENEEFFPLDGVKFSAGDKVNKDKHNHLFTMDLAVPFVVQASGGESFEVEADDDTFVYIGDELVIDMGGIHEAMNARFWIAETGEVYARVGEEELAYSGVRLEKDKESVIRIFHADRDAAESVFKMKLAGVRINVVNTELADTDGVQVAYEGAEYKAPLGVSKTTEPNTMKGYMAMMATGGVLAVMFAVLIMMVTRTILRER